MARMSEPQMVEARMASKTSPAPGSGSGSSRMSVVELPGRKTPRMRWVSDLLWACDIRWCNSGSACPLLFLRLATVLCATSCGLSQCWIVGRSPGGEDLKCVLGLLVGGAVDEQGCVGVGRGTVKASRAPVVGMPAWAGSPLSV